MVQTPNFPYNYPFNYDCTWILDAGYGNQVVINITNFTAKECCDFIEVSATIF